VNYGQDLPVLLNLQPNVVSTSDAGAGIGYTGIRIRGSDATRINVTINGIPVNDAESQGVFWVNMPDFVSSVDNLQVQRGVGTSTNGAGAFGGSVNMQTDGLREKAYSDILASAGSFNTRRFGFKAGTGLLNEKWAFDARLSRISSDGFIDRASSDLSSWYTSGGWYGQHAFIKAIVFSGSEKTYQAWYGVPEDSLKTGNRTFNPAGLSFDANGNSVYYNNETDNYRQTHYQLISSWDLRKHLHLNVALHATRGIGYYEQYKVNRLLSDYNLPNPVIGSDTVYSSNLVRRLWLDNWFGGFTWSLLWNNTKKWSAQLGGAANRYWGKHYGTVVWTDVPVTIKNDFKYYSNDAWKTDINAFVKSTYEMSSRFLLFADLQIRHVAYTFIGFDRNGNNVEQQVDFLFFNPKLGLTYKLSNHQTLYASLSVGNKEPNRDDFTDSSPESRPKNESLYDGELGWKLQRRKLLLAVNTYLMAYRNQLVVTGRINDVGAYTRENVTESYRAGVELETAWQPFRKLGFTGNISLSRNRILNYTEFVDDYANGGQLTSQFKETNIAFSPAVVAAAQIIWEPLSCLKFTFVGKHVGLQYLDNTGNINRSIKAYTVNDLRVHYRFPVQQIPELSLGLNVKYNSNGYTQSFFDGTRQQLNTYFPQAGTNIMVLLTARF
jgi:iron complex outermembrane receptor protein